MVEDPNKENKSVVDFDFQSTEEWLSYANNLVPLALQKAREVKGFLGRWKLIISKIEQIPTRLCDLSTHPFFSKNALCKEQLQAVSTTLNESIKMAKKCSEEKQEGKLKMQSDLDALSGKIDLNLRDCGLLIKSGVLGEVSVSSCTLGSEGTSQQSFNVTELFARLQIGHLEAKNKALDNLVDLMREDEKTVLPFLGRSSISAFVQLLTATSPKIREKTVTLICTVTESGSCHDLLVSEGVLPPLIRLLESGSSVGREKSAITLEKLSTSADIARAIVGHGGVHSLTEVCCTGDSVSQASTTCTLKNLSVFPDLHKTLAEEDVVKIMIDILGSGVLSVSKENAAECLRNMTSGNENLKTSVITEGGIVSLLAYLDNGLPQEPAIGAIRNLVGSVSVETLISLGLVPRLVHVLNSNNSIGAQKAALSTICRISESPEVKKVIGESGSIPLLIKLLETKPNDVRELAAQAVATLMTVPSNVKEVKRDPRSVPSLVQLLDPGPQNTGKKYAVCCLGVLAASRKCRKVMVSYGATGYLKKLTEMDIIGSKKLLQRLQGGRFGNLFGRD